MTLQTLHSNGFEKECHSGHLPPLLQPTAPPVLVLVLSLQSLPSIQLPPWSILTWGAHWLPQLDPDSASSTLRGDTRVSSMPITGLLLVNY